MSVDDGRLEYLREKAGPNAEENRQEDLHAAAHTVAFGRLLYRSSHGDEEARAVVHRHAKRGNELAATALATTDTAGVSAAPEPRADNVGTSPTDAA